MIFNWGQILMVQICIFLILDWNYFEIFPLGTKHLNLQRLNLCKKIWQTLFRFFEKFWMIKISCKNLLLCALAENTIIEVSWAPLIYFKLLQSFFRHCSPWTIPKMLRAFFQNLPQWFLGFWFFLHLPIVPFE